MEAYTTLDVFHKNRMSTEHVIDQLHNTIDTLVTKG